ncbi:hypothetical protein RvY_00455 [Ramazzottius varieornatus]|uniref:Uncharacterized protein n=1 Tax=Ramazzottius varieornatus TaxID=947166 RepID=A0A1D1UCV0_RAMVA|nr:hypothetical protein RvY_00455 [Ramazzottius varieornatus]
MATSGTQKIKKKIKDAKLVLRSYRKTSTHCSSDVVLDKSESVYRKSDKQPNFASRPSPVVILIYSIGV